MGTGSAAALWLCVLAAPAGAQDPSTVRLIEANGEVQIKKGTADWAPLKEGEVLDRGDSLACRTGASATLQWSNGSLLKVYPDTCLTLMGVTVELDRKLEKSLVALEAGRVFAKAQTPEHMFCHFEIRMGALFVLTQGAEFALKYDAAEKNVSALPILGRLVTEVAAERLRIEEGNQAAWQEGGKLSKEAIAPMPDKARESLWKVSKEMGGSLLIEETGPAGGPLRVRIGGVRNRRGNAPYKVQFKALVSGGSGKVKSIRWNFGDGETADTREAEHEFTQGVYVVILRIEDENGEKTSAQINISAEEDCNCRADPPAPAEVGLAQADRIPMDRGAGLLTLKITAWREDFPAAAGSPLAPKRFGEIGGFGSCGRGPARRAPNGSAERDREPWLGFGILDFIGIWELGFGISARQSPLWLRPCRAGT